MNSSIDINFDVRTDTPDGRDPDTHSATLQRYHQRLWSKRLPSGAIFDLTTTSPGVYLSHKSAVGEFRLSSDIMVPSYTETKKLSQLIAKAPAPISHQLSKLSHTVGGFIVFPSNRIDRKMTINGARGCNRKIHDRFDLTLECIRRHYIGQISPLSDTLDRYSNFFQLFEEFRSYVEFFLLQDLVEKDTTSVRFHLPFDGFERPALPVNADEYLQYAASAIAFIGARNARISAAEAINA